ncbi:hypothetical protein PV05_02634 [Exophiala xenobiotica]|uniref:Uncharacterized protein n=1 Tax=Exophiala xenobiotica TaxID=348802 RepID=A0A0D2FDG2_9EURO|nr:uncharacterized protein PV05_02634 [Exophiala xenobiotica]KIW58084.1 hypothetical protein PV05_02634 [Exophiala xenobiotica]
MESKRLECINKTLLLLYAHKIPLGGLKLCTSVSALSAPSGKDWRKAEGLSGATGVPTRQRDELSASFLRTPARECAIFRKSDPDEDTRETPHIFQAATRFCSKHYL